MVLQLSFLAKPTIFRTILCNKKQYSQMAQRSFGNSLSNKVAVITASTDGYIYIYL